MLELLKISFLILQLFLIYIDNLPIDCICNIVIYADDTTTLYSKCDQSSDLGQQVDLVSEFESNQQDILNKVTKLLVDFNDRKTQIASFDQSNNTGVIDVKMNRSVVEEKSSFKGCVNYIFASLIAMSKGEHFRQKEKCFLFYFENTYRYKIIKF